MRVILKTLALLLLLVLALEANARASLYFAYYVFPRIVPRPYVEMVSAALVGALVAAALSAYPLVWLYGRRAWLAGLVVASPVVLVRASDVLYYMDKNEYRIMVMSWVELLASPLFILLGVWFVFALRLRHVQNAA